MVGKEAWKKWFRKDNLIIMILGGVLLFIIALPIEGDHSSNQSEQSEELFSMGQHSSAPVEQESSKGSTKSSLEEDFATDLEVQLEGLLSEMEGVGKVKVMITLKSSEELVVEKDEPVTRSNTNESDSAGGSRIITQMDSAESTVYRTLGSDSEPYVIKTISPQVEGVVVVAQGAGSGTVNQNITELVQALFGVEAHKVKVVKMASSK
uniref:stage III sporulation protein AG n=1 Tax=Acetatifactor sp. TaxID=1872090 RepID=UPI00405732B6